MYTGTEGERFKVPCLYSDLPNSEKACHKVSLDVRESCRNCTYLLQKHLWTFLTGNSSVCTGLEAFKASVAEPSAAEEMAISLSKSALEQNPGARVAINAANLVRQNVKSGMPVSEKAKGRLY